jgi:hypothetical protein
MRRKISCLSSIAGALSALLQSSKILMMSPYSAQQLCDYTLEFCGWAIAPMPTSARWPISQRIIGVRVRSDDDLSIWSVPYNRYVENEEGARKLVMAARRR